VDPTFLQDDWTGAEYKDLRKLQGRFLRPRKEKRTVAVEALLLANNVLNTIYQSGKSKEAGAWLGAIPKTEALTMSASEFWTAFRNRLLIPHPQLFVHETCACGKVVDPLGVHMQKCKLDGNLTNSTYNRLVACVAEMARSCGQSVRVEVSGIFNNVDPSSQKRMDLVVYDPGKQNRLYDIVITNPVTQEVLESNKVNLQSTNIMQRIKERRYRELATEAGMLLHGAAVEVYGKWGDDFTDMLNHFVTLGSVVSNCSREIIANYWRRRICICLQSGVANAINTRSNRLTARTLTAGTHISQGESSYPGVVEEQSEAFRDGSLIAWGDAEDDGGG
jgi:hypothetical protein